MGKGLQKKVVVRTTRRLLTSSFAPILCLLVVIFLFIGFRAGAANRNTTVLNQELEKIFSSHDLVTLNPQNFLNQVNDSGRVSLQTTRGRFDLELEPFDIRAANYRAVAIGDDGPMESRREPNQTYRGRILNYQGATARFTISETTIEGMLLTAAGAFFVEPAQRFSKGARSTDYVFYAESEVRANEFECATTMAQSVRDEVQHLKSGRGFAPNLQEYPDPKIFSPGYEVELATEADFEYFQIFGSSTNQNILNILNQADGIYEAQLGISLRVVFQRVWTTQNDPYSSADDMDSALSELRSVYDGSFGNNSPPQRDLVHFWTGKNLDGGAGIAYVRVICSTPTDSYALSRWQNTFANEVGLATHEIGHNLGADHPNAQNGSDCPNSVMADAVTPYFCHYSREQITRQLMNYGSCLTRLVPPGCTYSISPTTMLHPSNGGSATVNITTSPGCAWGIAEFSRWISITANETGTGNGSTTYSVAPNSGGTRRGNLDVAGKSFEVTQVASEACPAAPINFNDTISGSWNTSDCAFNLLERPRTYIDRYYFVGSSGQHVAIELTAGSASAAYLVLVGPDGSVVTENSYEGVPLPDTVVARIPSSNFFTLPANGTYIIEAASWVEDSTGPYTLSLTKENVPNSISFSATNYQIGESGAQTIEVVRPNGSSGAASINYAVTSGTATAGQDFTAVSGTLNFAAGELTKSFQVNVIGDNLDEANETVSLTLSSPGGTGSLGAPSSAALTITDDDAQPSLAINDVSVTEGDSGTSNATFTVTLSPVSGQNVGVRVTTANGTALAPSDYAALDLTLTFAPGEISKSVMVPVAGDTVHEATESFFVNLSAALNADITDGQGVGTINDTDPFPTLAFAATSYSANEGTPSLSVEIRRTGDPSQSSSVSFSTSDTAGLQNCNVFNGAASQRCDYAVVLGSLSFAAGESSKNIFIPLVDDSYAEGSEAFTITLNNPSGATLGSPSTANVTIVDNDSSNGPNPLASNEFFIRQHYIDFLGREPDPPGFAAWLNIINNCGTSVPPPCDRIEISSAFFRSTEFQGRGYFIYRFYPTIAKVPIHAEFIPDFAKVSGFLTDVELEAAKSAFVLEFMSRTEFQNRYGATFNNSQAYVDALLQTVGLPNHPARQGWINQLGANNTAQTRAQVLRELVESPEMYQKFYNEAFVLMQYFGYLRRTADASYLNWIQTMNSNGGDYRTMINGFLNSDEYRQRFGP